jgi:ParB-like chromosome segregation protein Spo0J
LERFVLSKNKPRIEDLPVTSLVPYAKNSRTHSDEQVAQVAASIKEFGFTNPILVDGDNVLIAGHGRLLAAQRLGLNEVPCIRLSHLTESQKRAYVIADNKLAMNAGWDDDLLMLEIGDLKDEGFDVSLTGFSEEELAGLVVQEIPEGLTDEDAVPELPDTPKTVEGDVWVLGNHRLMCGDSTSIDAVEKLMAGQKAQLLHADPPYGMGKEADGVANDNLYKEKLDAFQMEWWATLRTFMEDNASAYIWGNAPDLWRLWYVGGLSDSERVTLRNEIVWNKKHGQGMGSKEFRSFPNASERCLFFMLGEQGFNNNADNYWDGWEEIRLYLVNEKKKTGLSNEEIKSVTNTTHSHYWTTSQWAFPTKEHYEAIQNLANGAGFHKSYDKLKKEYDKLKKEYDKLKKEFYESRCYFDNSHDNMTDAWEFSRVTGLDRHGHATPKPVEMMERIMRSSLPSKGLCVEPFGGSGSTLMGAEKTSRICYTMELQPKYCDVIIKRWQDYTGKEAVHEDGTKFNA